MRFYVYASYEYVSQQFSVSRKILVKENNLTVPQTDTGGRVEYTKAIGRTILKELGNESWT